MKSSLRCLASAISSLSLFTISLSFSLPVKAALPCQSGTINYYQNGSVESCTINTNVDVSTGSLAFPCKQGYSILFDDKAHFKSCVISSPVRIIRDNAFETCPEEYRVYVECISVL